MSLIKLKKAYATIAEFHNLATTSQGRSRVDEIQIYSNGYAEPGYTDPLSGMIAIGNWNKISRWSPTTQQSETIDTSPEDLADALEKLGVELEWSDEWTPCADCGRLVRTTGNCYGWVQSYRESPNGDVCHVCVKKDPTDYLAYLESNPQHALTIDLDLTEHGYMQLEETFEHGLYGGQSADPKIIAESLRGMGIDRFIFSLDSVGQFDADFTVWIHKTQWDQLDLNKLRSQGADPAEMMKRALRSAPIGLTSAKTNGSISVTTINLTDGTSSSKRISPQDFIDGKALD